MSDPSNQRADGCSVFFTLIVLVVLLSLFYAAQRLFEPEAPAPVMELTESVRRSKVENHQQINEKFTTLVDQYHKENNSSLESSMNKILSQYRAKPSAPEKQSN
jgi:hypothetical protein